MAEYYASCEREDWMTPQHIRELVASFRDIDLDPCAPADPENWFATYNANGIESFVPDHCHPYPSGLVLDWYECTKGGGCAFVNPPYGGKRGAIFDWAQKCAHEAGRGVEIVGLVPGSTGSKWFELIWDSAVAVCFVKGRVRFEMPESKRSVSQTVMFDAGSDGVVSAADGAATFWSVMPYWGADPFRFKEIIGSIGRVAYPSISRLGEFLERGSL